MLLWKSPIFPLGKNIFHDEMLILILDFQELFLESENKKL